MCGSNNTSASTSASGRRGAGNRPEHRALRREPLQSRFLPDGKHYLLVRGGRSDPHSTGVGGRAGIQRATSAAQGRHQRAQYARPIGWTRSPRLRSRPKTDRPAPFDTETLTLAGAAMTLAEGAVAPGGGMADFHDVRQRRWPIDAPSTGKEELVYDWPADRHAWRPSRQTRETMRVSPDGKRAAFTRAGDGFRDVWIADLGRFAFHLQGGRSVWSPRRFASWVPCGRTRSTASRSSEEALRRTVRSMSLNDLVRRRHVSPADEMDTTKPALTGRGLWLSTSTSARQHRQPRARALRAGCTPDGQVRAENRTSSVGVV